MTYESYRTLRIENNDRVLTITMNEPEKLNAVGERMHEELAQVFVDAALDADVDLIVLTGEGRAFSATSNGCKR